MGTKNALTASLVGWVFLCFAALSFAPLEYTEHSEYQVQIDEIDGEWHYTPHANLAEIPLAVQEGGGRARMGGINPTLIGYSGIR